MIIYDSYGNILLETEVSDRSGLYTSIDNRSELTLMFTLDRYMEIPVGSWCEFDGGRYELMSAADVKMNHTESYDYTMLMSSDYSLTSRFKVRNTVDGRLKFDMVAKPHELVQLVVDNLNQRSAGWSVGTCVDSVEKMVSFNHTTCQEALNAIASVFKTELEVVGKKVSLGKVEYNRDSPLALGYGKGNGFRPGIQKTKVFGGLPVEKLFIQGGSRNISLKDYGSSELHLPKSLSFLFDGSLFEGEDGFDASRARRFVTDADGSCVMLSEISAGMEDSLDLSEVYPSRVGIVSHVIFILKGAEYTAPVSSWTDDDWNEVQIDIIDDTIPDGLDYKECTIEGETMTLVFQSGILAGREFGADFISGRNRFEIVKEEIDGQPMPQGVFIPSVGDTYAVFNVSLPDSYISSPSTYSGAEYDALREASRHLYENCVIKFSFTGELDGIWAKKDWVNIGSKIRVGGYVSFTHEAMFPDEPALVRIVGVTQYVNNPHSPKIELSNATGHVTVSSRLNQVERNEAHVEELHKEAKRYTKRTFNDAKSAIALIEKALGDKFSESIKPATVQTMMMLVGDESLQFMFVDSVGSSTQVAHSESYDAESKTFSCSAGVLKHMTLGINEIRSGLDQNYRYWSMEAYESARLADASAEYYVYAVVQRNGSSGVFRLETSPVGMYDVEGSYYLLLGLLLGESEGSRSYMPLYGFTQVLPGQITTDVIRSADGKTFFNLVQGIIGGRITFASGSSGLENLSEWSDKQSQINKALNDAKDAASSAALANASVSNLDEKITDVETGVNKSIQEINQKLDGVVESYFDAYTPTRSNLPASEWIADGTEAEHIGDTFTNTALDGDDAGKSWRWLEQEDGTYDWQQIADSDAAKALALAGQAKETADGKSRTFLVKPSNYSKGDLWIVGSDFVPSGYVVGSLLCASASSTTYVASHWSEKVRYTDDTTANEAMTLAGTAKETADDASASASAAQTSADNAQATANEAKANAASASTLAQNAKTAADNAKTAADNAQKDIDDANERLEGWASNGYISPMEQTALKQQLAQVQAEYSQIIADADRYGVAKTSYVSAYNKAVSALEKYSASTSDGSDIAVGTDYANIAAYYTARATILDAIATEVKEEADKAIEDAASAASAANVADAKAASAADTASSAKTIAESASSLATQANNNASKAITDAGDAKEIAENAESIAGGASALADSAKKVADAAQTSADTAKQEAQEAAADAQEALTNASDAKAEAENAASRLDELTADGYISPMEKQSLKNEMAQIDADYNDIRNEVDKYIIVNETILWNAYDNAYDLYRADILSKINTEGSVAVGSLSSLQSSYYSARTDLLNAIYVAAKKAADDAQSAADDAQETADAAQSAANSAQETADAANALAQQAKELADTVDAATQNLDTKIGNVETGLLEDIETINARLDGVVENYFEEGTPTLDNYPANEWTTDDEKKNHLGDTYTNIQEFVDEATTPDAGKSWRWTYTDSEHTGYHWHPIADSDAVKALLEASKAQAAADGKSRTFVAKPVPPYSVGDLWVQGDAGEIMKCIVSRSTGTYVASDWAKASKYTDDTVAEEAKELAQQAKDAALAAQNDATEANNAVSDLVENTLPALEDGIIDEAEKIAIEKYLNIVNKEFADVTATHDKLYANELLPAASKLTLLTAYNNLKSATTTLLNCINGAILENPTYTAEQVDSAYSDYKDKFAAYSTAIEAAYAAIEGVIDEKATAAKEVAEAAKEATDALDNDLIFTVAEKRSIRKALKDINPSETDATEPYRWMVSARASVTGNAWSKVADASDANHGWYVSDMHTASGSTITKVTIQVNEVSDIEVSIMSRAEGNFDYTLLSLLDKTLLSTDTYATTARVAATTRGKQGQTVTHTFKNVAAGTHYFTVMYRKDTSGDTAPDNGYYKISDSSYANGSLGDWMSIIDGKGYDTVLADPAVDAADALFSYLYDNGIWTDEATSVAEGFRDELYGLFQNYYKEISAILTKTATSDLDYLANAMRNGKTVADGGLVMTSLVAVGDTEDIDSADVEAFMNGSDFASDETHGKLLHALGIPEETSAGSTDLEERAKEAKTRMYEDGYTVTNSLKLESGCEIADMSITEEGIGIFTGCSATAGSLSKGVRLNQNGLYLSLLYNTGDVCAVPSSVSLTRTGLSITKSKDYYGTDTGACVTLSNPGGTALFVTNGLSEIADLECDSISSRKGMFAGLRPNTEKLTTGRTLTELDHTLVIASGTLYLPSSPKDGQHYRIVHTSTTSLTVRNASTSLLNILKFKTETSKIYTFSSTTKEIIDMTYCADDATWYVVFC